MIKMTGALLVSVIALQAPLATAAESTVHADSKAVSLFVQEHYSSMIEDYVEVFMGHIACQYDFIEEEVFNSIADKAIKAVAKKATAVVAANESLDVAEDSQLGEYIGSLTALAVIDVFSSAASARVQKKYDDGTLTCENSRDRHRTMYLALCEKSEAAISP